MNPVTDKNQTFDTQDWTPIPRSKAITNEQWVAIRKIMANIVVKDQGSSE